MAKTVVGLFDSMDEAQRATQDLMQFGVRREDISMVARDNRGDGDQMQEIGSTGAAEGAGAGAVGGTLVGGALGLLVGTGLLAIPGIGPVLAAGPLAAGIGTIAAAAGATALGAGIGAAAGGLFGGLLGAGIPEDEAHAYVEGVRRGGTLLSVAASDVEADDVRQILLRNGAVDMSRRSGEWREAGWAGSSSYNDSFSPTGTTAAAADTTRDDWQDSSKLGTAGGTAAGAATGAAIGAAGGPVGAVIGGLAGAATGAAAGASGDVAGERVEDRARREGEYDFKDDRNLADVDRQVVDTSYTTVDRTGERTKDTGYATGHSQPLEREPEAFGEFLADDERNFRTTGMDSAADAALAGHAPYRADGHNIMEQNERTDADTMAEVDGDLASESGRRSPRYAGADDMGGAISNMTSGSGSSQPGRMAAQPGEGLSSDQMAGMMENSGTTTGMSASRGPRIYESAGTRDSALASETEGLPAHGDFARGQRNEPAPQVEADFARGMHSESAAHDHPEAPHHGDFARGQRDSEAEPLAPDYARGQRGFEQYDNDFLAHYRSLTGAGGQPYDYYKPGYQFGYELGNGEGTRYSSWSEAEADVRQSWQRDAQGSWDEFQQMIRYGWEKARGRA